MEQVILEVAVRQPRDVPGAQEGGASRLSLATAEGLSPEPALVRDVLRETDLPLRVMLRLNETWMSTGGEFARLVGLAEDYLASGAEGLVFGFLDSDLQVDIRTCLALAERLPDVPWTFHRAVDDTLEPLRTWQRLRELRGLTAVASAGSPRGLAVGADDLLATLAEQPDVAQVLMPAGGLVAEQVPWFVRAGVRQFHIDEQTRPGGSYKAYVDAALVRSFRLLLDHTAERAG